MRVGNCGTKEQIFDESVRLFAMIGYESVSMRDIAEAVGIQQSSIYNHYAGKASILNSVYDYFRNGYKKGIISGEDMHNIIQSGSIDEIMHAFTSVSFVRLDQQEAERMMLITKIIYTRMFLDPVAAQLYRHMTARGVDYVREALDYGVSIGRFKAFETQAFSYALFAMYTQLGMDAFSHADYQPGKPDMEDNIKKWMGKVLCEKGKAGNVT